MKKFIFAVHNHQPVGNFEYVFRNAFELSYRPFIDLIFNLEYPKVCFHFSGILYEWIEKNFPKYLDRIIEMVKREQVEILSGGYYEPILSIIPDKDALGQIEKLNSYIFRRFGVYPKGLWLTERVYHPKIIDYLVRCGIEYIVVDDTHLLNCGINQNRINDIFITENNGNKIYVFPINHRLRYLIPYHPPYKTLEYINNFTEGIFVMADDGEKFGFWPESYRLVYEDGWLRDFFETLRNSSIVMKTFSMSLLEHNKKKTLVYIPITSYFEMTEWALDYESAIEIDEFKNSSNEKNQRFIRGGIFENFFTKYNASNMIHKRVRNISFKLERNYDPIACDFLYRAECNCGWWHGVFGGIYLPHIRHAIYENLLRCQKRIFRSLDIVNVNVFDIDLDDKDEIEIETENNYIIVSPTYGGSLIEFSSKNKFVNYSSVMSRLAEPYHKKEIRDINGNVVNKIREEIIYDWHERRMLLDHFITKDTTIQMFASARYPEQGDFIPQPYEYAVYNSRFNSEITLIREGTIWYDDFPYKVNIQKKLFINSKEDGFDVRYIIRNLSEKAGIFYFLCELVFGFSSENVAPLREIDGISEYIFNDDVRGRVKINFSIPIKLWIFPLFTCSNSEFGIEKTYQGSVVGCIFENHYNSNEEKSLVISVRVS